MPKSEHEYTKTNLTQINSLYKDETVYKSLYMIFYNGANKSQEKEAEQLRQDIISLTDTLIKNGKTIESPQLTKLLENFKNNSPTMLSETTRTRENEKQIRKTLKAKVKVTDKLSSILPYTTKNTASYDFANPTMIKKPRNAQETAHNESNVKTALLFNTLTAYNGMAKKVLNAKYLYTQAEKEAISDILGEIPNDADLNPSEILDKLTSSYQEVTSLDFVQAADRTNYLKKAGFHGRDFGVSGIILGSMVGISFLSTLFGAPLDGGNFLSWMMHLGNQAALLGITAGIGIGGNGLRQYALNKQFNKQNGTRDQVRQVENKKELFASAKRNKKVKAFELENPNISLGRLKGTKYKYLRAAASKELTFGAKKSDIIKADKLASKHLQAPRNVNLIAKKKLEIGSELSPTNPLTRILGIQGTKASRRKAEQPVTTVLPTMVTAPAKVETRETVATEKKPEKAHKADKVELILNDTERKKATITLDANKTLLLGSKSKIKLVIHKLDAHKAKNEAAEILQKIKTHADEISKRKDFEEEVYLYNDSVEVTYTPSTKIPKAPKK